MPKPTQSSVGSDAKHLNMHGLNAQQKMPNVENVRRGDFTSVCRSTQNLESIEEDYGAAYSGAVDYPVACMD